jgi:hypothetical protein
MLAEPYDHFAHHARTNDELHIFRRRDATDRDGIVGFQLWRAFTDDHRRYVLGGKLRVDPSARRHALHHTSNLAILLAQRERHPHLALTRLAITSLHGFVSLTRALPGYRVVDTAAPRHLIDVFDRVTRDNHYVFDAKTGLVDVGITIPSEQLAALPPHYFTLPEARAYLARNADFARNRCFLAVAWEVAEDNLSSLLRRCGQQSPR